MQLVLSNAQSELSPLEIGIHALEYVPTEQGKKGRGVEEYARYIGKDGGYIRHLRLAAEVYRTVNFVPWALKLLDKAKHLTAIHAAPHDTWPLLVEAMLEGEWSKEDTEKAIKRVKELLDVIPAWWTVDRPSVSGLAIVGGPHGLKAMFELAGELAELKVVKVATVQANVEF